MTLGLFDLAFVGSLSVAAYDADAQAYITAVEAADGQALETAVRDAINAFVVGCKADGIWTAIKASCILAGARTLSGALTPLVGAAPTRFGTAGGWNYNRETGLAGNGTDNYLNSNRNNNADPQNSNHNAVYVTTMPTISSTAFMGATGASAANGTNTLNGFSSEFFTRNRSTTGSAHASSLTAGLVGMSRASSSSYTARGSGTSYTANIASQTPENTNILVFRRADTAFPLYTTARLAFYSIGESLNLALLDARLATLMSAIAVAIP